MSAEKKRRRRGERADKRIQVTLTLGRRPDGKPDRKSFYGRTRAEAEALRDAYKRDLEDGMAADAGEITVEAWVDTWYAKYQKPRIDPAYEAGYLVHVKRLKNALGKRPIAGIREADLQAALFEIADMSNSSIEKYHSVIAHVFRRAQRNKLIRDNPAEDLIIPDGTEGSHRALEKWETDCILTNWHLHRTGLWAMLMLLCGLRRGEMMALDWSSVDMGARYLTVCASAVVESNQTRIDDDTKTDAGMRILPICKPLYTALSAVPEADRVGLVCRSAAGKQMSDSAFRRGWAGFNLAMQRVLNGEDVNQAGRRVTLASKIEKAEDEGRTYILFSVRAHDLRHTFATALYDAGVPVKAAQYYLGHADIRMTLDLYTHLSKEREKRARSQMTGYLDAWLEDMQKSPRKLLFGDLEMSRVVKTWSDGNASSGELIDI